MDAYYGNLGMHKQLRTLTNSRSNSQALPHGQGHIGYSLQKKTGDLTEDHSDGRNHHQVNTQNNMLVRLCTVQTSH
jgi:hypothetical protein